MNDEKAVSARTQNKFLEVGFLKIEISNGI